MGLFGGGSKKLTAASAAYNNALRDYNYYQMNTNRDLINNAGQYVNLGPESDIAYDTASGQYLNANPYINQIANNTSQSIIDTYNKSYIPSALSSYAGSGRFGSGLFQRTLADTQSQMNQDVGNAINNLYYGNYNQERQYQEAARNRIASQYDPLNRYSSYSGIVNAYTPAQPAAEYKTGRNWGTAIGTGLGTVIGAIYGGPMGAAAGASAGGALGSAIG